MRFPRMGKADLKRAAATVGVFARAVLQIVLSVALSAVTWLLLLSVGGSALAVRGVFVLYGDGWAQVLAGALALCGAALIRKGMTIRA